jgi:hypothetical protein
MATILRPRISRKAAAWLVVKPSFAAEEAAIFSTGVANGQPRREPVRLQLDRRLADDLELGVARRGQLDHQPELRLDGARFGTALADGLAADHALVAGEEG